MTYISSQFQSNLPYPAVCVDESDQCYVAMISDAYAGKGSETTAIAQYRFHRLHLKDLPDIYDSYHSIASVEMMHQDLLGALMSSLRMEPKLFSRTANQYWNGKFPAYKCKLIDMLEADAQGERNSIANYTKMTECISNESIQALFHRIILDEELHLKYLSSLISTLK